jgi:hypothetical protein
MNVALLPVISGRSSSLPISADVVRDSPCCPSRHGSAVMVVDESASPPQSPRQVLIRSELTIEPQPPCDPKASDHFPCTSPPRSPPHSLPESLPDQEMDRDDGLPVQPTKPPQPPVRLLDDEEEHIHRSLRLQDFEVRGTLGTYTFGSHQLAYSGLMCPFQEPVHLGASFSSSTVLKHLHQPILPGFLR